MQNVSFKNLDDLFAFLPKDELKLLLHLRTIIFDCIPDCKEKLSYNVPYYKKNSNICFLWPASITWGNIKQKGTIRLGFTKGYLMRDEINFLEKGERKQVFWKDYNSISDIDIDLLKTYLFEAIEVDKKGIK